jgi:hypothetical protein
METKYTNYEGDWNEECPYCGKPQKDHQVSLGVLEGVRLIHRQPCPEEQHEITKKYVKQGIAIRSFMLLYNTGKYLWGLIPFKEELKLIWQAIKHVFVSIKALLHLQRTKPK